MPKQTKEIKDSLLDWSKYEYIEGRKEIYLTDNQLRAYENMVATHEDTPYKRYVVGMYEGSNIRRLQRWDE